MNQIVTVRNEGSIALIAIDAPPVNAMSVDMRRQLRDAFTDLSRRSAVEAVVITCAGRTFVSGADLKEFDTGIAEPGYHEVFGLIEAFDRPVIAAMFGTALGAGVELALACHYRCASPDAKLGLPEVTLGIIPGAGGTQRLPRLVGARAAAEIILSAAPLDVGRATQLRIIDETIEGDLTEGAVRYAQRLVGMGAKPRPTAAKSVDVTGFDEAFVAQSLEAAAKKWRGQQAPARVLEAIRASTQLPLSEGLKRERAISLDAEQSLESKALRHLFFAEREVARVPGLSPAIVPREIHQLAIVGAGTMGRGIAISCMDAGIQVRLIDSNAAAITAALDAIRSTYEASVSKSRISNSQVAERLARLQAGSDHSLVRDADLVIEAAYESMDVKRALFEQFDRLCKSGAVLATNTSTLDVNALAAVTTRPESVVGLHFFSPANIMRLLEIVRGRRTSPETLATAVALAKKLRKVGVVVGVCYGFVGNRMMLEGYVREADQLLLEGATPQQLDRVLEAFGFAMGPCAMNDMAGNDIALKTREAPGARDGKPRPYHEVIDELARRGQLGQKTGAGFYIYEKGSRTPLHNPRADELIESLAAQLGIQRRVISDDEIVTRCVYALINEGARILQEGIAARASDIDVIWTTGYGFPRFRGGPMFYADSIGLAEVHRTITDLHRRYGHYWQPAPLLTQLAESNGTFANWQGGAKG